MLKRLRCAAFSEMERREKSCTISQKLMKREMDRQQKYSPHSVCLVPQPPNSPGYPRNGTRGMKKYKLSPLHLSSARITHSSMLCLFTRFFLPIPSHRLELSARPSIFYAWCTTLSVKNSNFVFIKVKAACNSLRRQRKALSGLVRVG